MNKTEEKEIENRELFEKFIVLVIEDENFIIPLVYVNEIVRIQDITEAPHQPEWVRGIMNLRDSVITLVDTRKRLGVRDITVEIASIVEKGKAAHVHWFECLESTVNYGAPFNLALNHNLCEYGKWSNETVNKRQIREAPKRKLKEMTFYHESFHRTGREILDLVKNDKKDEAINKLEELRNSHLANMLANFNELESSFKDSSAKEIAVILEFEGIHFAMLADSIQKMKTFLPDNRQKGSLTNNQFVSGVYDDAEGLYQELDLKGILTGVNNEMIDLPMSEIPA